jgi:hydroxymethylglutaryl-CoA reductase
MLDFAHQADIAFSYAPGKIILIGEHAVLYGAKAIAMPIEHGIRVAVSRILLSTGQENKGPIIRGIGPFFMGDTFLDSTANGPKVLKTALNYLQKVFGPATEEMMIVVDGSLPPGCGLGSSASLSVALMRAINRFLGLKLIELELREHVLALETIFHGRPSGIDHAVVIDAQAISFKRIEGRAQIQPVKLSSELNLVIGIAGPHDGTKNAVKSLNERKKRQEQAYLRIFQNLDQIAEEMEQALINGQRTFVGELMNIAQGYLNALSLSTPEIEKLCAIARERGALGAKLTGAGGGGAVIVLCDGNETEISNAFKAAGYQSFITRAISPGNDFAPG